MDIRAADQDDVPDVLPMVAKICAYHEALDSDRYGFRPRPENQYKPWLDARTIDPHSVFLVADAAETAGVRALAGFLIGTVEQEIPVYRISEFGFIHDLWVEEDYRHEGIGRQLVTMAIEKFAQMGVAQLRLDTAFANTPAQQLFAKCGFRPAVVEMLCQLQP